MFKRRRATWHVILEDHNGAWDSTGRKVDVEQHLLQLGPTWEATKVGDALDQPPQRILGKDGYSRGVRLRYPAVIVIHDSARWRLIDSGGPIPAGAEPVRHSGCFITRI